MRLFAHDLAAARTVYMEGHEPEMTVKLPKDVLPFPDDRVVLHNRKGKYGEATAECEAVVLAVALIVRPDWTTYRNPHAERQQETLL